MTRTSIIFALRIFGHYRKACQNERNAKPDNTQRDVNLQENVRNGKRVTSVEIGVELLLRH